MAIYGRDVYMWKSYFYLCDVGEWVNFQIHVGAKGLPQVAPEGTEIAEIAAVQKCANRVELEQCCQTHIFLQKCRFDTAENEPAKNLQNFVIFPILLTPKPQT